MTSAVLLVEDDENLRVALRDNLVDEGYAVDVADTCAAARAAIARRPYDVVVLDLMLPDGDGYAICRELRADGSGARVLMLTARTLEDDVVKGFVDGADDYVAKPYRLRELLARVGALARRTGGPSTCSSFGGFTVDDDARLVRGPAGVVDLTKSEFDVLRTLLTAKGRALSRDRILDEVRGRGVMVDERTVDNFVMSLKKKLAWSKDAPWRIASVRGIGDRMEVDDG